MHVPISWANGNIFKKQELIPQILNELKSLIYYYENKVEMFPMSCC